MENIDFGRLKRLRDLRIVLPVFFVSIIACIDRVNVAYAKLTMVEDLPWITPEVFGAGAGIFFIGYLIFEIPGSLVAAHFSATKWIARIMFTWGLVCVFMAFISTEFQFYLCRFLLGASEASLYPVIYSVLFPRWFSGAERARATSLMLTSLLLSNIIGAPIAGVLLESSFFGLHGWQELFILEAIPALAFALFFFFFVKDRPAEVSWLTQAEKDYLTEQFEREQAALKNRRKYTVLQAFRDPKVLKLCLIYFLWVVGFWGFYFWMPTVLKDLSGLSTSLLGGAIAIPMTAALVVQILIGHTATRTGDKVWHVAGALFVGAIGLSLSPHASSIPAALFLVCLSAIGIHASMGVWWTIPTTFLTGPAAAGSIALINSCGNIGGWVGPNLMAWVKVSTGAFDLGYYIMGAMMFLSGLLVLTIRYRLNGARKAAPSTPGEAVAPES
ncbi:MFS transporter [Mitsuokella sp. oral taxon 131]|uniref:MFS transporter n=1 Tax=Mitsuokella sp. oral taxon 131 TaxID=1321780 RepID=UPI0003AE0BFE|nr:MFS transporter [Mitsuokella sp. oral taxon 131]ERL04285.1 transporter, major facilitator family protein [Mitsuokella sp. oral taxon 131 str. W9106]